MRKIEAQMLQAIDHRENWSSGNTMVTFLPEQKSCCVFLHANLICRIWDNHPETQRPKIQFFDADWQTSTTKSRINVLARFFGVPGIYQKAFNWFTDENTDWEGFAEYDLAEVPTFKTYPEKFYRAFV